MSRKSELKRQIADSEKEIEALEKKRERSQSAVLRAVLTKKEPDPNDVEYFRVFSELIDSERAHLRSMIEELNGLSKKKKKEDK